MLRLLIGAAVVLAGGAALAQPPANPDYFPLKRGSKWVFNAADQEVTVSVVGTKKLGGRECFAVETSAGGQVTAAELYAVKDDGVYRMKVNGDLAVPPVKLLALPVKRGESWAVNSKIGPHGVRGKFTVTNDKARVKVPAGEFEAVLVDGPNFDMAGANVAIRHWFAPDKGLVKTEYAVQGQLSTLELKEYAEGK